MSLQLHSCLSAARAVDTVVVEQRSLLGSLAVETAQPQAWSMYCRRQTRNLLEPAVLSAASGDRA
jgi:hypothetical protein